MEEDLKLVLKKSVLNGGCILFAETDLMNPYYTIPVSSEYRVGTIRKSFRR